MEKLTKKQRNKVYLMALDKLGNQWINLAVADACDLLKIKLDPDAYWESMYDAFPEYSLFSQRSTAKILNQNWEHGLAHEIALLFMIEMTNP